MEAGNTMIFNAVKEREDKELKINNEPEGKPSHSTHCKISTWLNLAEDERLKTPGLVAFCNSTIPPTTQKIILYHAHV